MSEELLMNKIDNLTSGFNEFKSGIGTRLEKVEKQMVDHYTEIEVLTSQMTLMLKIGWLIFATSCSVIVIAAMNLLIKR